MKLKEITRTLPCKLSDVELLSRADELATVVQEVNAEENRQTNIKAQMKARLTELDARKTRLAITVARKEEDRDVPCVVEAGELAGTVTVCRMDTGETLETRPMSEDERQRALGFEAA